MGAVAKPISWMDHTNTKNVVCPYCGDTLEDDGEWHSVKVWACEGCGNRFRIDADYTVTFTTRRIADPLPAEQPREGGGVVTCPDCRCEMMEVQPPKYQAVQPGECVYYFRCPQCQRHGERIETADTLHGEQPREGEVPK